jgi:PAS domain S-box-containing protein
MTDGIRPSSYAATRQRRVPERAADGDRRQWLTRVMPAQEPSSLAPLATLASHLLDRVEAAVVVVDLGGIVMYANPYCELLYGRAPEDMIGEQSEKFALAPISEELRSEIGHALQDGRSWEGDFTVVRANGTSLEVHAIDSPVFDQTGEMSGVISLAFDATEQRRAQGQLRRLVAVVDILRDIGETVLTGLDEQRVMRTVTDAGRRLTRASVGAYLERDLAEDAWVVRVGSGNHDVERDGERLPNDAPVLRAALTDHGPTRFDDLPAEPGYSGALDSTLRSSDRPLRSCVVAPVRSRDGRVLGAIVLAHPERARFTNEDQQVLVDVAAHAGIVLDIATLFRAAEREIEARRRAEDVQRFYAETSALLSWSLDYPETFERLARLCVPFLADLCVIDVADETAIRRVAAVHADPARADLVAELERRFAPDPYGPHPAASVVRGGQAEVAPSMTEEFLRATTRDEDHYRIVKELEFTSYMCVPLTARGRTIGALTLVSAGSGRSFGPSDLAIAEELGRRAALAIDNARLFADRDYVARALQSSLLPPSLPAIPGVQFAARYRAAGEGNEVGGDFYDVFQGGRNAWWFVVGDVSGKGPQAAAIAGLARHTLHAVALERRSPRRLLSALHETLANGEGQGEFCTVCCALLRPGQSGMPARLAIACGGHPPPIIRRADRSIEIATCSGPLLGASLRASRFVQQTLTLEPGDMLIMYTDGVTEAHHRNAPLFGEERLARVVADADDSVDGMADSIVSAVRDYGPPDPRDDLAIVVVQIDGDKQ